MGHRNLGHLATHHQQIIHFTIIQAVIHRLIRAEDSFRGKLLRGFLDKIFLLGGHFIPNSSKWAFPVVANSKLQFWRANLTRKRVCKLAKTLGEITPKAASSACLLLSMPLRQLVLSVLRQLDNLTSSLFGSETLEVRMRMMQ